MRSARSFVAVALSAAAANLLPGPVANAAEGAPPRAVSLAAPVSAAAGDTVAATATVRDSAGAPLPGATVVFTETGAGRLGEGDIVIEVTGPAGEASAALVAVAEDAGPQTVRATIGGPFDECGRAAGDPPGAVEGACSAEVRIEWRAGAPMLGLFVT
ncbi:MAG: Ig-like domain-containing protein, partial [Actinomycetota bacterium]